MEILAEKARYQIPRLKMTVRPLLLKATLRIRYVRVVLASKTLRTAKSKKFVRLGLNPFLSYATNGYLRR